MPSFSVRIFLGAAACSILSYAGAGVPVKLSGPARTGSSGIEDFAISPDNKWVVYRADQDTNGVEELYFRPTAGSDAPRKLNGPLVKGGNVGAYSFMPNGKWVVYLADEEFYQIPALYARDIAGSQRAPYKVNGPHSGDLVLDFKASADNQWLAYRAISASTHQIGIYCYLFGSIDEPKQLSGPLATKVLLWHLTPDGKSVVYVADEDKTGVFELYCRATDASGTPRKLSGLMPDNGHVQALRITPDSRRVIYLADQDVQERLELYSAPIDGSAGPIKLNSRLQPAGGVHQFELSPDGHWVVYLADAEQAGVLELYSRPADGSGRARKLNNEIPSDGFISSFSVSPNGNWIVYGLGYKGSGFVSLFSQQTVPNGPAISLSEEPGLDDVMDFTISPDSRRVIYNSDDNPQGLLKLYSRAIDGSDSRIRLSKTGRGEVSGFIVSTNNHILYFADDDQTGITELYFLGN